MNVSLPRRIAFFLAGLFCPFAEIKADHFRVIDNSAAAFQCRVDLIQQAKQEILVSYYIIKDDASGNCILGLLADAAQRGVLVRVLMDANASRISRKNLRWLQCQGVQIRKFRIRSDIRRFWHRLHDKILLVDLKTMVIGGRNLKNDYFGMGKKFNYQDCDALIRSDSASYVAREHFYSIWNRAPLSRRVRNMPELSPSEIHTVSRAFSENREHLREKLVRFDTQHDWFAGLAETDKPVHFIHDDFFRKKDNRYVETTQKNMGSTRALIRLVEKAEHTLYIENPYFCPTRIWRKTLKSALDRGVKIRLLTNSARTTDVKWHYFRYRLRRKQFLQMGLSLWEYQGAEKLHTKAMVIDHSIVLIGSYNLHLQSQYYNTEVGAWVQDKNIADVFMGKMALHLRNAKPVSAIPK